MDDPLKAGGMADRKSKWLAEQGHAVIGYIHAPDSAEGRYALCDGSVRWLTKDQYLRLMHEQDSKLFDVPVQQPAAVVGQEPVYSYRMKWADGTYSNWSDCTQAHHEHLAKWPDQDGFQLRTLYTAPVPAAGVQGDFERKRADFIANLSAASAIVETWPDWKKNIWPDTKPTVTVQPDSGRDAALAAAITAVDAFADKHLTGEALETALACMGAIRALAAHPAPSSDAALELYTLRRQVYEIAKRLCDEEFDAVDVANFGTQLCEVSKVCGYCGGSGEDGDAPDANGEGGWIGQCSTCGGSGIRAAHPANGAQTGKDPHWFDSPQSALGGKTAQEGYLANPEYSAQAGLSDPEIDEAVSEIYMRDYQGDSKGYERAIVRAALAAQKKGQPNE